MSNLKAFTVAPVRDSVRTAFFQGQRAPGASLRLVRAAPNFPEYVLQQNEVAVAIIRGKELVCGGEHFAVIPILPRNWEEQGDYVLSNANVPYWDGEQRLRALEGLLYGLSCGLPITEVLADAVTWEEEMDWLEQPDEPDDEPDDEVEARAHCEPEQPQEYLWTVWYEGRSGGTQRADLTCTREMAGKVWDVLAGEMTRMLSARP